MSPTVNSGKPAWFELADNDALSADVRKVDRKLPAVAVLVTGAILATGAFFANGTQSDANAALPITGNAISNSTTAAQPTQSGSVSKSVVNTKTVAAPVSIKNPVQAGIPAPTGRGDDEGRENDREDD